MATTSMASKVHRRPSLALQAVILVGLLGSVIEQRWLTTFPTLRVLVLGALPLVMRRRMRVFVPPEFEPAAILFLFSLLFLGSVHGDFRKERSGSAGAWSGRSVSPPRSPPKPVFIVCPVRQGDPEVSHEPWLGRRAGALPWAPRRRGPADPPRTSGGRRAGPERGRPMAGTTKPNPDDLAPTRIPAGGPGTGAGARGSGPASTVVGPAGSAVPVVSIGVRRRAPRREHGRTSLLVSGASSARTPAPQHAMTQDQREQ